MHSTPSILDCTTSFCSLYVSLANVMVGVKMLRAVVQLPTLGRVYGLLVMSGQLSWRDLIAYAMLPYGEGQFWTNASQHYRTFAVQFIAYALEVQSFQTPAHCYNNHAKKLTPS